MPRADQFEVREPWTPALRRERASPVLLTERLMLRAPLAGDIGAILAFAGNRAVAAMAGTIPSPCEPRDVAAWVEDAANGASDRSHQAIVHAGDEAFMGLCTIEARSGGRSVEIGFWLVEPFWGRGYMTEAMQALVDWIFRTHATVGEIEAPCRVMNVAARRVLQKCGFQFRTAGLAPSRALRGAVAVDWYGLDRKTWISLRNWRRSW